MQSGRRRKRKLLGSVVIPLRLCVQLIRPGRSSHVEGSESGSNAIHSRGIRWLVWRGRGSSPRSFSSSSSIARDLCVWSVSCVRTRAN
eukprot:768177-Hanusia_phi.AAC.16